MGEEDIGRWGKEGYQNCVNIIIDRFLSFQEFITWRGMSMEMDEHQWHWYSDDLDYCKLRLSLADT